MLDLKQANALYFSQTITLTTTTRLTANGQ